MSEINIMQDTGSRKSSSGRVDGRKKTTRKSQRKKSSKKKITLPIKKILIWLILLGMFLTTIGAVGYVIFFRTVIAANLEFQSGATAGAAMIAEYRIPEYRPISQMI